MACGLTPELARMLGQMGQENERKAAEAEAAVTESARHAEQARLKMEAVQAKRQSHKSYDWTYTYEQWDAYEDPEDLAKREQEARERSERAARAQMGCNHDHSAEQKLMDMSTRDKIACCEQFRLLGNAFFAQGQYQRAAYHYHSALVYFEYMFPDTDDENDECDALKLKVLLNFAACRLKTAHYDQVVHHCDQALQLDADSVKALYRRAQAYRLKDEFELAMQDITQAMALAPDPLLAQEKVLLQAKMLAYQHKSKQVSAAMFGGGTRATTRAGRPAMEAGFGLPDTKCMPLQLIKTSEPSELLSLDSWKPCSAGLKELDALLLQSL